MFEKKVKNISEKIKSSKNREYYILTHKKHRREIYFRQNNEAIKFIKPKFNSPLKKIIYALIKTGFLQMFLKKV